jgi:hypothetical protein
VGSECEIFSREFIIIFYFIVIFLVILFLLLRYVANCITWTLCCPYLAVRCCSQATTKWRDGATIIVSSCGATALLRTRPPHCRVFEVTHRHTALGWTPLEEGSALRRGLYLTTQNIHKRQTSVAPAGFESALSASERPQTYASDRATTRIGVTLKLYWKLNLRVHAKRNFFMLLW